MNGFGNEPMEQVAQGGTISIREVLVGALNAEMGIEAVDPDLQAAAAGGCIVTPAGMVLDGSLDRIEAPTARDALEDPDSDGKVNELSPSLVDYLEFYLLNYFKPATHRQTATTASGFKKLAQVGCASCHVPDLRIESDRRVADVETVYDPARGSASNLDPGDRSAPGFPHRPDELFIDPTDKE